ncbi:hypothetical protein LTR84_000514 [Exophiala bonariae]|uniref:Wbp11/ELF5/Saf1 N-terminal domain-containing protein n=1 Tax=Exophiala bonariae TaxID=1690606 RepID=A0AAV9NUS6_9EURO|nr:hypothetical protein LTR84_000514 [Exophiala bonariae]
MARDKERSINPAQQQRKLEKQKQLKKSRAELQERRNEKLAKRNPDRIERQIQDLKALEASGEIKAREKAILEDLERDLRAVRKAREALGEKAPNFGGANSQRRREGDGNNGNVLGKRRHDGERKISHHNRRDSSGSDTDDSVRRIPMPEDTPPPIPREFARSNFRRNPGTAADGNDAANAPQGNHSLPNRPTATVESKTTYSSAPQIRDLKKEAVGRFVPDVVRRKQEAAKGGPAGRLLEPEEMDRLEAEGYLQKEKERQAKQDSVAASTTGAAVTDSKPGIDEEEAKRLAEEERRFLQELEMQDAGADEPERNQTAGGSGGGVATESLPQRPSRNVQIEEVEDEDA